MAMKETPKGWPRISSAVFYDDAHAAIDWLQKALGFELRLKVEGEGGRIEHSELVFGDGLVMVGSAGKREKCASPRSLEGANTQSMCIYVDDVDAACERARAGGGKINQEPETDDYGEDYWADRSCEIEDPEGHHWWLMQRVRG
jgi:uncharacterized glyoxalase superfamily protein PhnB